MVSSLVENACVFIKYVLKCTHSDKEEKIIRNSYVYSLLVWGHFFCDLDRSSRFITKNRIEGQCVVTEKFSGSIIIFPTTENPELKLLVLSHHIVLP